MSQYFPDKWVVVKISGSDTPPIHKVFASWYGGYAGSDSWKLNSGITRAMLDGTVYSFDGSSGSIYYCNRESYGLSSYGNSVLSRMINNAAENNVLIEILPEETNWLEIHYE
jgi:hypothetical protein